MLACSLAIATWKRYGPNRWALRCNPSSGNLHPTEAYLVLPGYGDLQAGLYHYRPQDHRLEQRCAHPETLAHELIGLQDRRYQVLYQFTVGKGQPDARITSEPAYPRS